MVCRTTAKPNISCVRVIRFIIKRLWKRLRNLELLFQKFVQFVLHTTLFPAVVLNNIPTININIICMWFNHQNQLFFLFSFALGFALESWEIYL